MPEMTIDLPDSISEAEAKTCLAAKLFEAGRLSWGQAAELAGYSKRTFMELLSKQETVLLLDSSVLVPIALRRSSSL